MWQWRIGVAVYETRWFHRWARKVGMTTHALCDAVHEMRAGLYDANLGGGLFKKRIGRPGRGKSSGFRTLVATNGRTHWVFLFGFSKNERGNIDEDELAALKKLAVHMLSLSEEALDKARRAGELMEVDCDAKNEVDNS
jgi:hypothetical protein